jgi:nicotinate-nucleotide adenylyltransferase
MLGLLGGTFDPVHCGHLRTALDVVEALDLAELRLVPLRHAVHRPQPQAPAVLRLAMLRAAVADEPRLVVDDRELRRDAPSYTVHTLESLRAERGPAEPICLLVGDDAYAEFLTWHRPEDILRLAHLVVMQRPGAGVPDDPALAAFTSPRRVERATELHGVPAGRILFLPVTQLGIAATDLRARLRAGRSVRWLVPDAVLAILERERPYGPA